jgi:hypothetical protein
MPDFTYTLSNDGWFTLVPENDQAVEAWNVMAMLNDGSGKFPCTMFNSVKSQIKKAGYSIRKGKVSKGVSDSDLLAALGI